MSEFTMARSAPKGPLRASGVLSLGVLSLGALLTASCSTVEIGRARVLAGSGSAASSVLVTSATQITDDFANERDAEDLRDALLNIPETTPSADFAKVLVQLRARRQVAVDLQTSYSAFAALAGYNAGGEFSAAATGLFDAVDAAGAAADLPNKTVRTALGQLGGEIAGLDQARRLHRASLALSSALQTYLDILTASSPGFVSVQKHSITAHYQAVTALWSTQLLTSAKLLGAVQPEDGLELIPKGDFTSRNPAVDRIVQHVLARRRERAQADITAVDQAHQNLVSALIRKHHEFEAGRPLDMAELQALATALATSTATIAQSKGS